MYQQVREYILQKIRDNAFPPGESITPERDLCKELNVSRSTVRLAIQDLVQKGYLYRVQGNGTFVFSKDQFSGKKERKIGVILDYCDRELEARMLSGIEAGLAGRGYSLSYRSSGNDYKKEAENIQYFKNEGVMGLIILPAEDQRNSTTIADLQGEGFPFVLIDHRLQNLHTDCVMSDNIAGGYLATEYLIGLGHERIAFIKNRFTSTSSIEDRITGYRKAMDEYDLEIPEHAIFSYDSNQDETAIYQQLHDYIAAHKPTAVVALHDYVALHILKMGKRHGLGVPEDLSVIGFDNLRFTKHLETALTTVAQFPVEIGQQAAGLLLSKLESAAEPRELIRQIYYPVQLKERESCRNIKL